MSSRDKLLYTILSGFTLGILARSLSESVLLFLAGGVAVTILFLILEKNKKQAILLTFILLLSFGLGVLRFMVSIPPPSLLSEKVGIAVTLEGIISDDPDIREFNTKLTITTETDTVLATVPHGEYLYGDRVTVAGKLALPENFETETGRTFDYVSYLGKDDIQYLLPKASVTSLSHNEGSLILKLLFTFKHTILSVFEKVIPNPERSLMGGILLGTKQSLGKETHDALVATGTIHIVALSGYNVSVVASFFMYFLRGVASRIVSTLGGGIAITLFVLMTGASATAVRAGTMATLVLVAQYLGRPYDAIRILLIAGVSMLIVNPHLLADDISFQLSFLATAGIILIEPIVRKWFLFLRWNWLVSLVSVTLAAQITVLPFLVYTMGTLSLVSLPVNFLILPLVELVMLFGALTAFLGIVLFPLATPVGYITYLLLHFLLFIIMVGADISFAAVTIPKFHYSLVIVMYGFIVCWIYTESGNRVIKSI